MQPSTDTTNTQDLAPVRVRHPLKFRLLQVSRVTPLSPSLVRITLHGDDLADFASSSFDDHVKVFFPPTPDAPLALPAMDDNGKSVFPEPRPVARDFTPRRYDRAARELDLEFALHGAKQARIGQTLGIGGPRGSMIIPTGFDWHLLIGDETALPAIARRLEELPADARIAVLIEANDPSARIEFDTSEERYIEWCYRSESTQAEGALLTALRKFHIPHGDGFVWAAGEAAGIRAVRDYLCKERGIDKSRIRAASYWRRGDVSFHENIND
jgi:NADPH-dependent ferric siderophore reductase